MNAGLHQGMVRRETLLSIVINVVLSGVFFLVVFGLHKDVPVQGMGALAFDCLPQAFAVAFMGSLVPGLLTRRRVRKGQVTPDGRPAGLPIPLRALLAAIGATFVLGGGLAGAFYLAAPDRISFAPALILKLMFGALVALLVTPSAVRAALRLPLALHAA